MLMATSFESMNDFVGVGITHIGDGRKGELQGERREALREVLLVLLGVDILIGGARVLRDDLVHDVLSKVRKTELKVR
jgi:hypothetical protein